jgi:endonuclease/exonuclease/phosphatase family metal-dependent hydrolase
MFARHGHGVRALCSQPTSSGGGSMKRRFAVSMLIVVAGVGLSSLEAYAQGTDIKVVTWNVENNDNDPAKEPGERDAIVAQKPAVVFLQEVDRVVHLDSIVAALEAAQPGTDWYQVNIERHNTTTGASFLAILARFPFSGGPETTPLSFEGEVICGVSVPARAAIGVTILIDGNPLAVFSTRNFFRSGDCVAQEQNRRFKAWANANFPNVSHLYGGDFNMVPTGIAYPVMTQDAPTSIDAWKEALDKRTATATDDSTPDFLTPTTSSRLDYLFYRIDGTVLSVQSAHITGKVPTTAPGSADHFASDDDRHLHGGGHAAFAAD